MNINDTANKAYIMAVEKGHHDFESPLHLKDAVVKKLTEETGEFSDSIPDLEGVFSKDSEQSEIADIILVLMAYCGACEYDVERILMDKIAYNSTRPYKHIVKK